MSDQMISLKDVAKILAIAPRTLRKWVAEGKSPIPFTRVGTWILRARQSDVEDWMRQAIHRLNDDGA